MSYDVLRGAVKEAWENVGRSEFEALIRSMPARCEAVIDANMLSSLGVPTIPTNGRPTGGEVEGRKDTHGRKETAETILTAKLWVILVR